jgi:hypothetical protein
MNKSKRRFLITFSLQLIWLILSLFLYYDKRDVLILVMDIVIVFNMGFAFYYYKTDTKL